MKHYHTHYTIANISLCDKRINPESAIIAGNSRDKQPTNDVVNVIRIFAQYLQTFTIKIKNSHYLAHHKSR